MIPNLEGRDKVNVHAIANKVNEIIDLLNNSIAGEEKEEKKDGLDA